jgi:hypothetical protein
MTNAPPSTNKGNEGAPGSPLEPGSRGRRRCPATLFFLLACVPILALHSPNQTTRAVASPAASQTQTEKSYVGNDACKPCHAEIFSSYSQTAMACASGPATQDLIPGDFQHAASGVHYRIYVENDAAYLGFDRPGDPTVRGTRRLQYFIGSGHRGRTYLFSTDGFFFEAPVNWYAQKKVWDTARADPTLIDAASNLGVIEVRDGHVDRAIRLWDNAFAHAPGRSVIGMNLARTYCGGAQLDKTRTYVTRVLQFNPDLQQAKALMKQLNTDTPNCSAR